MGYIELKDGISSRRINVPGLTEPIHIDVAGEKGSRIVVPAGVTVDRHPNSGRTLLDGSVESDAVVPTRV